MTPDQLRAEVERLRGEALRTYYKHGDFTYDQGYADALLKAYGNVLDLLGES